MYKKYEKGKAKMNNNFTEINEIQEMALNLYGKYDLKDSLIWMTEEFGEVVSSIRKCESSERIASEFGDLLAWVFCLGNILNFNVSDALQNSFLKEIRRQLNKYETLKYANSDWKPKLINLLEVK